MINKNKSVADEMSPINQPQLTSGNMMKIIIPVILVVVFAGLGFTLANYLGKPKKIKEKVILSEPLFKSFNQNLEDITKELADESKSGSDSDSLERTLKKNQDYEKKAKDEVALLKTAVKGFDIDELKSLKDNFEKYFSISEEIIKLENESNTLLVDYIAPVKKTEEITVKNAGVSNLILTQPDKYVETLSASAEEIKGIINKLEKIKPGSSMVKLNQMMIETYKIQLMLLEDMVAAVKERSMVDISKAEEKYVKLSQDFSKEFNQSKEEYDDMVKEKKDNLKKYSVLIEDEYRQLKIRYDID